MTRGPTALALALALAACRRSPAPAPPSPSPAATPDVTVATPESPYAPYRVDPAALAHAGAVRGRVTWAGPRPALPATRVPASGNPDHCGAEQPWPALDLGPDGGVRWSVLALRGVSRGAAPSTEPATVDQQHCRYDPHVLAVAVGAELRFTNSDPGLLHNVHAYYGYDGDDNWFNAASPHGLTIARRAQRVGVARLICDAGHTWMAAYVHTFAHPYFAVTDAEGRYQIARVPPGRYALTFWHEGWTELRREQNRPVYGPAVEAEAAVTVAPDGTATVDWSLSPTGASPRQ